MKQIFSLFIITVFLVIGCEDSSGPKKSIYEVDVNVKSDVFTSLKYTYAAATINDLKNEIYILFTNVDNVFEEFDGNITDDYMLIIIKGTTLGQYSISSKCEITIQQEGIIYYSNSGNLSVTDINDKVEGNFEANLTSLQTGEIMNISTDIFSAKLFGEDKFGYKGKKTSEGEFDDNFIELTMRLNGKLFDDKKFVYNSVSECRAAYNEETQILNIFINGKSNSLITQEDVTFICNLKSEAKPDSLNINEIGNNTMLFNAGENTFYLDFGKMYISKFESNIGGIFKATFKGDLYDPYTKEYIDLTNGRIEVKITG